MEEMFRTAWGREIKQTRTQALEKSSIVHGGGRMAGMANSVPGKASLVESLTNDVEFK